MLSIPVNTEMLQKEEFGKYQRWLTFGWTVGGKKWERRRSGAKHFSLHCMIERRRRVKRIRIAMAKHRV